MSEKKIIAFVSGSRSDYGLLEPLIEVCQKDFKVLLFVTGSHLSHQLGRTVNDIKVSITACVDVLLDSDIPTAVSLSQSISLSQFATIFKHTDIDLLVVLGDRFEIIPPVLAAYNTGIPVVHIEGDDITLGSLDEGYRGCIRSLASYHFTAEEYGSLGCVYPDVAADSKYEVIIVYHPYVGWSEEEYRNILEACNGYNCLVIAGSADPGGRQIQEMSLGSFDSRASMPRAEYLSYLKGAKFIIGNSSSGIIEAPCFHVPSIDVGNRQRGRKCADSVLHCEGTLNEITNTIEYLETNSDFSFYNPYAQPDTVKNMIEDLKLILSG